MPYDIVKRSGKHCVRKSDTGEVMKCYDSNAKATAYLRALYANVEDAKEFLPLVEEALDSGEAVSRITKEDGRYIIETVSTAALPDREDETFTIEAIDYDIAIAKETGVYPEYRVFHSSKLGIGRVKEMRRIGIFAYDKGESYTDSFSQEVVEKMLLDNTDGKWRTSRGFRVEEVNGLCPQCGNALAITKEHMIAGFRCPACETVHLTYRGILKDIRFKRARTFDITVTDVPAVPYTSASAYRKDFITEMKEMNKKQLRQRLLDAGLSEEVVDERLKDLTDEVVKEIGDDIPDATLLKEFSIDAEEADVDAGQDAGDDNVTEVEWDSMRQAMQEAFKEVLDGFSMEVDNFDMDIEVKELPDVVELKERLESMEEMVAELLRSDSERIKELASHSPRNVFRVHRFKEGGKSKRHMMDEEEDEEEEEEEVTKETNGLLIVDGDGRKFSSATDFLLDR